LRIIYRHTYTFISYWKFGDYHNLYSPKKKQQVAKKGKQNLTNLTIRK